MTCKICGKALTRPIFSTPHFDLLMCDCGHVQQDPMGTGEHEYHTPDSLKVRGCFRDLVMTLYDEFSLDNGSRILDVGCGDGELLEAFRRQGCFLYNLEGVEPNANTANRALQKGFKIYPDFNGFTCAPRDIITCIEVLPHVPDLHGFISKIEKVLAPNGAVVFEMPYVVDMVECGRFDMVTPERLHYFSIHTLINLLSEHGLFLQKWLMLPCWRGGSFRAIFSREEARCLPSDSHKVNRAHFSYFQELANNHREAIRNFIILSLDQDVAYYGGGGKAKALVDYITALKPCPTLRVINSPEDLTEIMPDYCLILPINFTDEIMAENQEYVRRGGHFVRPIPLKVLT